jgi:hypothetical protein
MSLPSYACERCESSAGEGAAVYDLSMTEEQKNRLLAMQIFMERDMDLDELLPLDVLWERESNWRTQAANPNSTARGIPQAMASLNPETWDPSWMFDPRKQIEWGLDYIAKRYGSPSKALEHHDEKGWY